MAFLDIDGLKDINDRDGHEAGDRALRTVVATVRARLRSFDPLLRYGGDEFVAGMGGINLEEAEQRFKTIREVLKQDEGIGISVGIAVLGVGDTVDVLIARADAALYRARRDASGADPA